MFCCVLLIFMKAVLPVQAEDCAVLWTARLASRLAVQVWMTGAMAHRAAEVPRLPLQVQ